MTATTSATGAVADLIAKLKQIRLLAAPAAATYSIARATDTEDEIYVIQATWQLTVTEPV